MAQKKTIIFDDKALNRLGAGVNTLADAVKVTLGPRGRNVALDKNFGSPNVTKDGVSVARDIDLEDHFENMGAQVIKEAAIRTAEEAGDGTTTATVIAQALFNNTRKLVTAGLSPIPLKRGMDKAVLEGVNYLHHLAKPISKAEEIKWVASISSNGDDALGELIAEAMEKVGKGGVISVEEGRSTETTLEFTEGMQLDRGYIHPDFVRGEESGTLSYENPLLLIADERVSSAQDLLPVMEYAASQRRPLVVIAHDVEGEAMMMLLSNHAQGTLKSLAIKAPRIGDKRTALLEDLAILSGATLVSKERGNTLQSLHPQQLLGGCDSVSCDKNRTTLLGGDADLEIIEDRIKTLRSQAKSAGSPHDQEHLQKRLSQLGGGMAVIRVGANSEVELKEYKARVEDALSATKAAVAGGVVPGGGCTLLEVSALLKDIASDPNTVFASIEEREGWLLVASAVEAPFRQIVKNAGLSADVLLHQYRTASEERGQNDLVYDVNAEEIRPCFEAGIVDPVLVVEQSFTNSVSVASTLLTTSCAIGFSSDSNKDDEDEN